ncbi:MAG: NAD-dependent epimerase/dehydratase family protein [Beijerinckiaceae bacterium]|nr:NAD-dependent epimerase/dehydratase family protein [Beijerinckiaceae bacterium]MCZ8300363.1 NAD-dependent epimerase/dehydratase family protein [Beijerinckiaceae bacterium]
MSHPSPGTVLVLGLTGAIGLGIASTLASRGWSIRALTRRPPGNCPVLPFPVEWRHGDALDSNAVAAAAEGVALIIHGVNPPSYQRWREDGLPMLANTIAAAEKASATILFPANVYVFSEASPQLVDERTPRQPTTRKGKVRLEMEQMLEEAATRRGVRVIALRAGDFFGPGVTNSWFAQALAKGGRSAKVVRTLSPAGIGHAWAYLPDLAETFARLVDRRAELPAFTLLPFGGHADRTGRMMAEAVQRGLGQPARTVRPFPWVILWLGAPFVAFFREALEMTWLWKTTLLLDNTALRRLIGEEPHTPLDEAVKAALAPTA